MIRGSTSFLRDVARTIVSFDRSAVETGFALRCTTGVAIPLIVAGALGHLQNGFAPALGAFVAGATSLQGINRSRLLIVVATTFGIAISSYLGALAAPSLPALIVLTALVGYLSGTISQLGMPARVAALNTTVAFIVFSALPLSPRQDLEQSSLLLLGGLIQAALVVIAWPFERLNIERRGLAAVYRELARAANSIATDKRAFPPIAALTMARQILNDPHPFADARTIARFKRVLDDAEALRTGIAALIALPASVVKPQRSALANAIAVQCDALAGVLDGTRTAADLEAVRTQTLTAFDRFEAAVNGDPVSVAVVQDIAAHVRDATQGVAMLAIGKPVRLLFSAQPRPRAYVETHIDWLTRDTIRTTVILSIAMLMGHTLFSAERGYWIPLTAALVLRPDLHSTFVRGFARIAGTLTGAVLAMLAVIVTRGEAIWESAGIVISAGASYLLLVPNYALFSTAITVFVILALDLLGVTGKATLQDRVLDTLLGGSLAMLGYVALPSWAYRRTRPLLADLIDAQRAFAVALLSAYATPDGIDTRALDRLRIRTWKARTQAEEAIDRARTEPDRAHTIATSRAIGLLGATQAFALSTMALEAGLDTMLPRVPSAGLPAFRDALNAAMVEIAGALHDNRVPRLDRSLEQSYAAFSAGTHDDRPEQRFVRDYAAGYVQSIMTIAQLLTAAADSHR